MTHFFYERQDAVSEEPNFRTPYEKDKGRIIHSEAFRRLQSKTQVLQVSKSDFYRTRLTHSLEVAQIGKGISRYIKVKYHEILKKHDVHIDHDVIEAICLAHDIGHPPFGHGGEIALNALMIPYGGFEGNAQTLRIVTKLEKYSKLKGMNCTRRVLLGLIKYPNSYSHLLNKNIVNEYLNNKINLTDYKMAPPKCYYDDEQAIFDWIISPFDHSDQAKLVEFESCSDRHSKTIHKSLDTSIMDVADNIAYSVHDFEDGYELGAFNNEELKEFINYIFSFDKFLFYLKNQKNYSELQIKDLISMTYPKQFFSVCLGYFVNSVNLKLKNDLFHSPYLLFYITLDEEAQKILKKFEKMVWDKIILSPKSLKKIAKGQLIVKNLFEYFESNPNSLPNETQKKYHQSDKPYRVICDYISGMTDRYALKSYKKYINEGIDEYI